MRELDERLAWRYLHDVDSSCTYGFVLDPKRIAFDSKTMRATQAALKALAEVIVANPKVEVI